MNETSVGALVPGRVSGAPKPPWLVVGDHCLHSRLLIGLEQYSSAALVAAVLEAGGCDVLITTVDLTMSRPGILLSDLDDAVGPHRYLWIGTTSFARSRPDAITTARLLRDMFGIHVIKLDVRTAANLPDDRETVLAAAELLDDGFTVLPFIRPKPHIAAELELLGCAAIRVLASPVGTGLGVRDARAIREVIEAVDVPVIVEGGLGSPQHAFTAIELGAAAVLVNTAVATAPDAIRMAAAMRHAVDAADRARTAQGRYGRSDAVQHLAEHVPALE